MVRHSGAVDEDEDVLVAKEEHEVAEVDLEHPEVEPDLEPAP